MSERRGSRGEDPSQQNTLTGRLTPAMFDDVLRRANAMAEIL
jgi:uracil-DNA glycosylase